MPASSPTNNSPHGNTTHGHTVRGIVSPTFTAWFGMWQRCNNPNGKYYDRYGGRGIKVCERWRTFENFLSDMGERPPRLTIERIDNDGNYEPSNCRWATYSEQASNRSNTRIINFHGQRFTLKALSALTGINRKTLSCRIDRGWSIELSASLPPVPAGEYGIRKR